MRLGPVRIGPTAHLRPTCIRSRDPGSQRRPASNQEVVSCGLDRDSATRWESIPEARATGQPSAGLQGNGGCPSYPLVEGFLIAIQGLMDLLDHVGQGGGLAHTDAVAPWLGLEVPADSIQGA